MAANTVTYFGDVTTVGNTYMFQNLTSQGNYSIFSGNVTPAASLTSNLVGFSAVYGSDLNVATLNTASIFGTNGSIGIGKTSSGYSLDVAGNIWASNVLTTGVVLATTSANALTLNTTSIFAASGFSVGIGTSTSLGANLHIEGNLFSSNALTAPTVFATASFNAATANTLGIFGPTGVTGIGTLTPGSTLDVQGNLFAPNSLSARVVIASTSANSIVLNTQAIFASSGTGMLGVGTLTPGASLDVQGNVWVRNIISGPAILTDVANTATMYVSQIWSAFGTSVGVGTSTSLGANLHVTRNIFASNALSAPMVIASISANTPFLFTNSVFGSPGVGVGTLTPGASLDVQRNVWVSNSLSAPTVLANVANTATMYVSQIWSAFGTSVGVGTSTSLGANLHVTRNIFASNALSAPMVIASISANTPILNTNSVFGPLLIGVGTLSPGASLDVVGNVWVSNSMTGALQFTNATFNQATYLTGTPRIFTPGSVLGIRTAPASAGASLQIGGNVFASNALSAPNVFALTSVNALVINTVSLTTGRLGVGTTTPSGWSLNIAGDLNISNGLTGTLIGVSTLNVGRTNVITISNLNPILTLNVSNSISCAINGASLANLSAVLNTNFLNSNIGFGNVYVTGGPTLTLASGANFFASNSMTTGAIVSFDTATVSVLNVASIYSPLGRLGIGAPIPGATLQVEGNVYASNAFQATNIVTEKMNASTINVTSLFGTAGLVGIGTIAPTANLHVTGAALVANSIQTNNVYASGTMNIAGVANILSIPGLNVGIGTSTSLGANLQVQGNIWASSLTGTNVGTATTTTANFATLNTTTIWAQTIQSSVTVSGNVNSTSTASAAYVYAQQSLQYTRNISNIFALNFQLSALQPATCIYANVVNGPQGGPDYRGSAYLGDGRVVFAPWSASNIGVYSPALSTFSAIAPVGFPSGSGKFSGAVVVPSGNVVFVPSGNFNVGVWNPQSQLWSSVPTGASGFEGGVLAPTGSVVCVPGPSSTNVGVFNPVTLSFTNVAAVAGYSGAVLTPNGNIICVPNTATSVGIFNPVTLGWSLGPSAGPGGFSGGVLAMPSGNVIFVAGTSPQVGVLSADFATLTRITTGAPGFSGGVLLPTGTVMFVPFSASEVGLFDPVAQTFSNVVKCPSGFSGGSLLPDGRVVMSPWTAGNVGVVQTLSPAPSKEFCSAPYFNHC